MSRLGQLMPVGVRRLLDIQRDLRQLGLPARLAFDRDWRESLDVTRVRLLPAETRTDPVLVVDVGANVGQWSAGIHRLLRPRRMVCFEPLPWAFERLQTRMGSLPGVELVPAAVGSHVGTVEMHAEQIAEFSSVLPLRSSQRTSLGISEPPRVTVPVTTLDEHFANENEVSLLKLDVQGYEAQVLAGAAETLKKTRVLLLEVLYVSYYEDDIQFDELHRQVISTAPFALYGVSEPAVDAEGRPMWADAVYVQQTIAG